MPRLAPHHVWECGEHPAAQGDYPIIQLLGRYGVRLAPHCVSAKTDVLADALSQGDMPRFDVALGEWARVSVLDKDLED